MTKSRLHTPVLLQESVDALNLSAAAIAVDATLGEGGHAREILARLGDGGRMVGIERDSRMISALTLSDPRLVVVEGNFREISRILDSLGHDRVSAVLADLGISARHYGTAEWGFSFDDGPLDMRLGVAGQTAADIVNGWDEESFARMLLGAGERQGRKIAGGLVAARRTKVISRTSELADLVAKIVGGTSQRGRSHPATKVFRALREAVTGELDDLKTFIPGAASKLSEGGRLVILVYTWEEERVVRLAADALVKGCVCPPALPECRCKKSPTLRWIVRKGVRPSVGEVKANVSARSAKLLVMERI